MYVVHILYLKNLWYLRILYGVHTEAQLLKKRFLSRITFGWTAIEINLLPEPVRIYLIANSTSRRASSETVT